MKVGRMLQLYRAAEQLGVRELAKEIGISASTLNRIERGWACDLDTWLRLTGWLFKAAQDIDRSGG